MTPDQVIAAKRVVAALREGTWKRPPRNPETGEREMGPSERLPDGSEVFALLRATD